MGVQRRVTAPPGEMAEAVTNSLRANDSPQQRHSLNEPSQVYSPPLLSANRGFAGTGSRANPLGRSSATPGLFR